MIVLVLVACMSLSCAGPELPRVVDVVLASRDGRLLVVDPSFSLGEVDPEYSLELKGPAGDVTVRLHQDEIGEIRRVEVVFSDESGDQQERMGEVSAESGFLAVGQPDRLREEYRVYGPASLFSVYVSSSDDFRRKELLRAAERALTGAGLTVRWESELSLELDGLSKEEHESGNRALRRAGVDAELVIVETQTMDEVWNSEENIVVLEDGAGRPFMVAFRAGWRDDTYTFHSHTDASGNVVAVSSQLIPE